MLIKGTFLSLCIATLMSGSLIAKDKVKYKPLKPELVEHKKNIDFLVTTAADAWDVPAELLRSICFHESGYRLNLPEPMDGGSPSYGICQVKLGTAKHMEEMFGVPVVADVHKLRNPYQNAAYAAMYLRYQFDRYKVWRKAVAAYNMGTFYDSRPNEGYVKYVEANLKRFENNQFSLGKPNKRKKDMRPSTKKLLAPQLEVSLVRKVTADFGDL